MNHEHTEERKQALAKLQGLVKDIPICMMVTEKKEGGLSSRPMSTVEADHEGCFWFFTNHNSEKVVEQNIHPTVHLLYTDITHGTYVHVTGTSQEVWDREKIKSHWTPLLKAWYPKGIDDPTLCLLKIEAHDAKYWDAEDNKMVLFYELKKASETGETPNIGEVGTLHLEKNKN
jgi:general stress protein 26